MYGIFTYIWVIFGANVGKYSIHGAYGYVHIYISLVQFCGSVVSEKSGQALKVGPVDCIYNRLGHWVRIQQIRLDCRARQPWKKLLWPIDRHPKIQGFPLKMNSVGRVLVPKTSPDFRCLANWATHNTDQRSHRWDPVYGKLPVRVVYTSTKNHHLRAISAIYILYIYIYLHQISHNYFWIYIILDQIIYIFYWCTVYVHIIYYYLAKPKPYFL